MHSTDQPDDVPVAVAQRPHGAELALALEDAYMLTLLVTDSSTITG